MAQRQRKTPTNKSGNKMDKVCLSVPGEIRQRVKMIAVSRGCTEAVVYRTFLMEGAERAMMDVSSG